jgi:hypothetical protein
MATVLTTEQLIKAIGKLEGNELESVTREALQRHAKSKAEKRFQREAELLDTIFEKKSAAFRRRYDRLNAKRNAFQLSPEEHEELLGLIQEIQAFDVRYVKALTELAQLRQIELPELMEQLGIKAR